MRNFNVGDFIIPNKHNYYNITNGEGTVCKVIGFPVTIENDRRGNAIDIRVEVISHRSEQRIGSIHNVSSALFDPQHSIDDQFLNNL